MKHGLWPHILLPFDEKSCGAINQKQHGQTHPLKPPLGSAPSSTPQGHQPSLCILPLEVICRHAGQFQP